MNTFPQEIQDNTKKHKLNMKRAVGICSFLCLFSLFLHNLLGVLVSVFGLNKDITPYIISAGFLTIAATLLPALFMIKTDGSIKKCLRIGKTKTGLFDSILIIIFGSAGCLTASFFVDLVTSFLPQKAVSIYVIFDGNFFTIVLMALSFAVLPAVCEEIAYRGYIYRAMLRYGQLYAVLFSSVLFSLMHSDIQTAMFAFLCGFIICCVRKTTGSILLGIIIHFINNLMSVIGTAVKIYAGQNSYGVTFYIITNVSLVLFIITSFILRKRKIHLFSFKKSPYPLSKKDKLLITISCPIFIGFVAAAIAAKFI